MKTTLILSEPVVRLLKEEAERTGTSLSRVVEEVVLDGLPRPRKKVPVKPLPTFHGGGHLVDISNRAALEEALGEDDLELHR